MLPVTGDCYAILGVHPGAEDVVIGAAYRALMRHYHPDTNPDPQAQIRAREITAAYALLRDPDKRAEYDANRAAGGVWLEDEPPLPPRPPAMRTAGIAAALLSLTLVLGLWAWPRNERPVARPLAVPAAPKHAAAKPTPVHPVSIVQLEPESERLANLRAEVAPALPPIADTPAALEPVPLPPRPVRVAIAEPARAPLDAPKPRIAEPPRPRTSSPLPTKGVAEKSKAVAAAPAARSDRLAALDRMATGFFSQSMVHANSAKQEALLGARNRSAALRRACRSDSCLTDAYLRQMREISAIMEGRPAPSQ